MTTVIEKNTHHQDQVRRRRSRRRTTIRGCDHPVPCRVRRDRAATIIAGPFDLRIFRRHARHAADEVAFESDANGILNVSGRM